TRLTAAIAEGKRQGLVLCGQFYPLAQAPDMPAVDETGGGNAMRFGAADPLVNGKMGGDLTKAALGVDGHGCTLFMDDERPSRGVEIAAADGIEILADAYAVV